MLEFALIYVAIDESLVTPPISLVVGPFALIHTAIIVYNDPLALSFAISKLPFIHSILVLLDAIILRVLYSLIIELIALHPIVHKMLLIIVQKLLLLSDFVLLCFPLHQNR